MYNARISLDAVSVLKKHSWRSDIEINIISKCQSQSNILYFNVVENIYIIISSDDSDGYYVFDNIDKKYMEKAIVKKMRQP